MNFTLKNHPILSFWNQAILPQHPFTLLTTTRSGIILDAIAQIFIRQFTVETVKFYSEEFLWSYSHGNVHVQQFFDVNIKNRSSHYISQICAAFWFKVINWARHILQQIFTSARLFSTNLRSQLSVCNRFKSSFQVYKIIKIK